MHSRTILTMIGFLALAGGVDGQNPAPGGGRMGRLGPGTEALPRFLGGEAGRPGRVVKNAPYSAEVVTESTQVLADGNRIHQASTARIYRDSEGRTRREQSLQGLGGLAPGAGAPQQMVFINDPVAGVNYALNPGNRTGTKSAWNRPGWAGQATLRQPEPAAAGDNPRPAARRFRGTADQNLKTESLGRQSIEGVPADGTRTTLTIPVGQMGNEQPIQVVTESWYSPDLQTVVLSRRTDPRMGETVYKLTNISRGDPPRTLFEAPSDFRITEAGARGRLGGEPVQR